MIVRKYKKRPVVIEAVHWDASTSIADIRRFVGDALRADKEGDYYIKTLEGNMYLSWGDYVIKGVKGEFYPCEGEIFEMTYDIIE